MSNQATILPARESASAASTTEFGVGSYQSDELTEYMRETLRLHRSQLCRWMAENGVLVPPQFSDDRAVTEAPK